MTLTPHDISRAKPIYRCTFHELEDVGHGQYTMRMTILETHSSGAPAGSRGCTSVVQSIDFVHGVCITRNSVYLFKR